MPSDYDLRGGTTSACAENTIAVDWGSNIDGNYLRVRGEYVMTGFRGLDAMELPPRARRIHQKSYSNKSKLGTTSACAENTLNELGLL